MTGGIMAGRQEHDLVVIGAGPGGYVAAIRAAQWGLNVACVEEQSALGGTCLRVGCIPSKALLESSERFREAAETFAAQGIRIPQPQLDLAAMLRRKDQVVTTLTRGVEALFKKNKITRYPGHAAFTGPGKVRIEGAEGPVELAAQRFIIATGSQPAPLPGITVDRQRIGTSTEALSYPEVPRHLAVIGAGYIGLELGSVWRRLGARVTVLEYLDRILAGIDSEVAAEAKKLFEKQGLEFRLGCKVTSTRPEGEQAVIEAEGQEPLRCDRVLVAVGRKPNTEGLGLDTIGVQPGPGGTIPVDDRFATSAPGVYALGDVIRGPMLAHKAEEEGIACADLLFPFRANGRARTLGQVEGFVKLLADAGTDRLLGAHILGPHAGDLINEAALAISFSASAEDLARTCHMHPTLGEALREAALAVAGRAIHI
jgi:dihydrolipoyl dehydrogenase